jgi:hypothetical protein
MFVMGSSFIYLFIFCFEKLESLLYGLEKRSGAGDF